jgi:hypothetical protein
MLVVAAIRIPVRSTGSGYEIRYVQGRSLWAFGLLSRELAEAVCQGLAYDTLDSADGHQDQAEGHDSDSCHPTS